MCRWDIENFHNHPRVLTSWVVGSSFAAPDFEVKFSSLAVNELRSGRKIDSRAGLVWFSLKWPSGGKKLATGGIAGAWSLSRADL